jgi:hypothetical protein
VAKAKSRQVQRAERRARVTRHTAADSERTNRMLIVGGIVAVIVIVIGLIGFGWWQTQIRPLSKTVLEVGDYKFNLAHLERRMELELQENPFYQGPSAAALPEAMMQRLEDEARLLQAAPTELNLTITEEDLATEVRQRGNLADDVEASVFANELRRQVEDSGLKENEYRFMLQAEIMRDKARGWFIYLAPTEEAQVLARWIVVDNQEDADEVLRRLDGGEDFVAVGQELSLDVPSVEQGDSDDDWTVRGSFPSQDLEDFFFEDADPGERSGVVIVGDFFYIAELLDRDDARPLSETLRSQVGARNMVKWLDELTEPAAIRHFSREDENRALEDVVLG